MTRRMTYSILQQQVREALEFVICYSVRKIRPSYTGYCMRVRRSSDNKEQDIGFIGQHLDIASLLTFVGTGNGFVSIWYNQGIDGNNYDVIQTTSSKQPQIVFSGTVFYQDGKPAVNYDGSQTLETKTDPLVYLGSPITIFGVAYGIKSGDDSNVARNWARLVGNFSDNYWFFGRFYNKTLQSMYGNGSYWQFINSKSGDNCNLTANSDIVWHGLRLLATTMQDGTDNYLYCNGVFVSKTTNLPMSSFTGRFSVGGSYTGEPTQQWVGNIQEIIIYRGQKLLLRKAIENNINAYFNFPGYKESLPEVPAYNLFYSIRLINENYDGYCIKVRRSSDDTEQNIGFTENGDLDESALLKFCGEGDGFIHVWYDQGGRASHLIQSDTTKQPQIVSAGLILRINDKPAVTSNGTMYMSIMKINEVYPQPTTYFLVGQTAIPANYTGYTDGLVNRQLIGTNGSAILTYAGNTLTGAKGKRSCPEVIYALFNGVNSEFTERETIKTGNAGTGGLSNLLVLAGYGKPPKPIKGAISELVIYGGTNKSSEKDDIISELRTYYSIPVPDTTDTLIWSLRLVNSNYKGYCIRVRRSSDDAEKDIGFSGGVLDTTTLLAFCGAGDGFVVTWYDQSDSRGENFQQITAASQPQIVSAGSVLLENGKPTLVADGSTLMTCSALSVSQPDTIFMVARTSTVSNDKHYIDGGRQLIGTAGGKLCIYGGSSVVYFDTKGTTQELLYALFNGSSSAIGRNGATAVTGNAGSNSSNPVIFNDITGSIQEIIMYPSDQSANRSTIESDINGFYSIY
ncbi:MAG TPA: arabinofuranosidase catalytic domain-containing protein [Paludibacter sp.]|nr:arabinofuranosidase catalytic domain-containing protein [Paludibacter sp.]